MTDTYLTGSRVWEAVTIEPGDSLIFATPVALDAKAANYLKAAIKEQLPDIKEVVLVVGVTQMGVYKPDKVTVTE